MSFQVSARKWRPQKFSELVGQEHIVRTLKNAIELDRVSHAYLYSGTRGVGKTTTARLFAKALNCEKGPTPEPCDQCGFCEEIREGRSIDVREIDGASNTGVAEVRELIDNIAYSASSCRYKVYIIDEVHMLSKSAFNALLKTLEEPPPSVIFIFATTELQKIPETILSRCQCFDFKPLSQNQIVEQMRNICDHEKIKVETPSLAIIGKTGSGSMRDAQSLLDQVIAFSGKDVSREDVEQVLGIVGRDILTRFVDALGKQDAAELIQFVQEVAQEGKDLQYFCRDLIEYVRDLMLVSVAKDPEKLVAGHSADLEILQKQKTAFHPDQLQQMFNILMKAETDMKRSSFPKMIFEMAVLRLTDTRPFQNIDAMIDRVNQLAAKVPTGAGSPGAAPASGGPATVPADAKKKSLPDSLTAEENAVSEQSPPFETPSPEEGVAHPDAPTPVSVPSANASSKGSGGLDWGSIYQELCERKPQFRHFLEHGRLVELSGTRLHYEVDDSFTLDLIQREDNREFFQSTIRQVTGQTLELRVTLADPSQAQTSTAGKNADKAPPKVYNTNGKSASYQEAEIIQDALDIFGGVVIR